LIFPRDLAAFSSETCVSKLKLLVLETAKKKWQAILSDACENSGEQRSWRSEAFPD